MAKTTKVPLRKTCPVCGQENVLHTAKGVPVLAHVRGLKHGAYVIVGILKGKTELLSDPCVTPQLKRELVDVQRVLAWDEKKGRWCLPVNQS